MVTQHMSLSLNQLPVLAMTPEQCQELFLSTEQRVFDLKIQNEGVGKMAKQLSCKRFNPGSVASVPFTAYGSLHTAKSKH